MPATGFWGEFDVLLEENSTSRSQMPARRRSVVRYRLGFSRSSSTRVSEVTMPAQAPALRAPARGCYGDFGGAFTPEVRHEAFAELRAAFDDARRDPEPLGKSSIGAR